MGIASNYVKFVLVICYSPSFDGIAVAFKTTEGTSVGEANSLSFYYSTLVKGEVLLA